MSIDHPYRVELPNTPNYQQGKFDGLCTYYTGAMMLTALFPAYASRFGLSRTEHNAVKRMSADPIIANYQDRDHDHRVTLAKWFYFGETISKMVDILNRIMSADGRNTKFKYYEEQPEDIIRNRILRKIDRGLPVMLGWDTEDYGCHAVLITGYRLGQETWLIKNDPGGGDEISWESLKAQQDGRLQIGMCIRHGGPRPLKSIIHEPDSDPIVYQWTRLNRRRSKPRPTSRYFPQHTLFPD